MNKDTQTIKLDYHLAKRNTNKSRLDDYYKQVFKKKREIIINSLLYLPHFQKLKEEINSEQIYRAVFDFVPGEGLHMWEDKNGRILPSLIDENHKIRQQARLVPIPKDVKSSLNNILLQNKLGDIAEHLVQLDRKVERILMGQHNDRVGIIEGAQDTIQQATLVADETVKRNLLCNAIYELNKGRRQLVNETKQYLTEFEEVPKSDFIKMINSLLGKLDFDKMQTQAISVEKNMQIIFEATYYQLMAYDLLGEKIDMQDIVSPCKILNLKNKYIEEEINKWIDREEKFTFDIFNDLVQSLNQYKNIDKVKTIEFKFRGKELLEEMHNDD